MNSLPSAQQLRRRHKLKSTLGLGETLFASADERHFALALEEGLQLVEKGLLTEMSFADNLADVTARYLFEAGGKRIRPTLSLLTAQLGLGNTPEVVVAAQAMEITHLASLYHDDVMDDADVRRGVPSAHSVWGNSVAILTGDLLFARASQLMASLGERAIRLQANTFERLVLGQLHETVGPTDGEDPIVHYIQVLADKTGSLISAAAEAGLVFANGPEEYASTMAAFGEKAGIAFQLLDDVIDLSPDSGATGKSPGTDLLAGVPTMPYLLLGQRDDAASADLRRRIDDGVARIVDGDDAALLDGPLTELREHEATDATRRLARECSLEAIAALEPLPEGAVREALTRFAQAVADRSG